MLVGPKQIDKWRRRGRRRHDGSHAGAPPPAPSPLRRHTAPEGTRPTGIAGVGGVADRDRRVEPSEDRALYTCQCGYMFQALVSTSVGCPHCGDTQAW
jgi:hypothetical protein